MKYYIVALFDKDSYTDLNPTQRKYSKKFKGNRNSPLPFITLDVVEVSNVDKITPIIQKVLEPFKKFKIEYDDNSASIYEPLKAITVNVKDRGYIKKIHSQLEDKFELSGIPVKLSPKDDLRLSLASVMNPSRDRKNNNTNASSQSDDSNEVINTLKIDRIEVWKMTPGKKEVCMKTFQLKSF